MKAVATLLVFLVCNHTIAQTIQKGEVKEINSGGKGISGVQIVYENALATDSDGNGTFTLSFKDELKAGDDIYLQSISKKGYELVNRTQLQILKLSSTDSFPEKILMAKHGVIDSLRAVWSGASINVLTQSYRRKNRRLEDALKNEKISKKELEQAKAKMFEEYLQQQKQIKIMADRFARINFDDVNLIYKKALLLFKNGQIDECLKLLEKIDVLGKIRFGFSELERVEESIDDLFDMKRFHADLYLLESKKEKAFKVIDSVYQIDSTNIKIQSFVANFYYEQHCYNDVIKLYFKIIKNDYATKIQQVEGYKQLGEIYTNLGNPSKALEYFNESHNMIINSYEDNNNPFKKDLLATSYESLGRIYASLGDSKKALSFYQKYNTIAKELYEVYPRNKEFKYHVAHSSMRLGSTYYLLGNFDIATKNYESYQMLMLELSNEYPNDHFLRYVLAISYYEQANIYISLNDYNKVLALYKKFYNINKSISDSNPKNILYEWGVSTSLSCLGRSYRYVKNYNESLKYLKLSLEISKRLYESYPNYKKSKSDLISSYVELSQTYTSLKDYSKSLELAKKSHLLSKELYYKDTNGVIEKYNYAFSCRNIGEVYSFLKVYNKSLDYYLEYNELTKELYENNPKDIRFRFVFSTSYGKLGDIYMLLKDYKSALKNYKTYNRLALELHESHLHNAQFKYNVTVSYLELSQIYKYIGNLKEHFKYYQLFLKSKK
ncbi:tetratricopeptide repeat protein [Kordia sp.]|uniref:tetratricopeptide repeat protein n=1 Tax=Kordia sp. TaxID=1965332 RepID=UPI003D2CF9D2